MSHEYPSKANRVDSKNQIVPSPPPLKLIGPMNLLCCERKAARLKFSRKASARFVFN